MAYRRNAESNRNALFGSNPSPSVGKSSTSSRPNVVSSSSSTSTSVPKKAVPVSRGLTGDAKIEKMKEAEMYSEKAKKALTRSLFSSPDPIAGAMFYHRAAECYKQCGENRLERLHRIASGDCQMGHGAYASAAAEYVRAAELALISDETIDRKRAECVKLYSDAAKAWSEEGDKGKAGGCLLKAGFAFLIGNDEGSEQIGGTSVNLSKMNLDAIKAIEAAIERHVPDPLNRYRSYRTTGKSEFLDPNASLGDPIDDATLELCKHHLVTSSFTHETLGKAVNKFVEYGEYKSALYAAGSVSAVLEQDGFSTISLSRAYCIETILTLALGDVVAADKNFMEVHLQNNNYLSSRECKLAEDLIRAIKSRNIEDLDGARDIRGENRTAISNLDVAMRNVIAGLRVSGAAKAKPNMNQTDPIVPGSNLQGEMDDLMNNMNLGDEEDDDEIDLT